MARNDSLRLPADMMNDPKVGLLPPIFQVIYLNTMLAIVWYGNESAVKDDGFAHYIRAKPRHFKQAMAAFRANGLVDENDVPIYLRADRTRLAQNEWAALREAGFERDDYTCVYCGERGGKLECDHVIPHSRGGIDSTENLVTACFACNRSKRNKMLSEWRGRNGAHTNH